MYNVGFSETVEQVSQCGSHFGAAIGCHCFGYVSHVHGVKAKLCSASIVTDITLYATVTGHQDVMSQPFACAGAEPKCDSVDVHAFRQACHSSMK